MADPQTTQLLTQMYASRPHLFSSEQAQALSGAAREAGLDFNLNPEHRPAVSFGSFFKQLGTGILKGATTIDLGDEPQNSAEAIAHSVGEVAGLVGFLPNPAGWTARGGALTARLVGGAVARRAGEKLPAMFLSVGSPVTKTADWIMKGVSRSVLNAPVFEGMRLMQGESRHILENTIKMGFIGAISAKPFYELDIASRVNGFVSMAPFGAINSFLGIRINKYGKWDVGKALGLDDVAQAKLANNSARAIASGIAMGLPGTLRGDPAELQIYEYLLNGFFGFKEPSLVEKNSLAFINKQFAIDKQHDLTRPSKIPGWEKLSPDEQAEVRYESRLRVGRRVDGPKVLADAWMQTFYDKVFLKKESLEPYVATNQISRVDANRITEMVEAKLTYEAALKQLRGAGVSDVEGPDGMSEAKLRALDVTGEKLARTIEHNRKTYEDEWATGADTPKQDVAAAMAMDRIGDYADNSQIPVSMVHSLYKITGSKDIVTGEQATKDVIQIAAKHLRQPNGYHKFIDEVTAVYPESKGNERLTDELRKQWWQAERETLTPQAIFTETDGLRKMGSYDDTGKFVKRFSTTSPMDDLMGQRAITLTHYQSTVDGVTKIQPIYDADVPRPKILAEVNKAGYMVVGFIKEKSSWRLMKSSLQLSEKQEVLGETLAPAKANHAMSYKMGAAENVTGIETSTLDLVESGKRTGATRSFALGAVGDVITFEGRPQRYRITGVERLTPENVKDPQWIKRWSKEEQWTPEHFQRVLGGKTVHIGGYHTTFEKIPAGKTGVPITGNKVVYDILGPDRQPTGEKHVIDYDLAGPEFVSEKSALRAMYVKQTGVGGVRFFESTPDHNKIGVIGDTYDEAKEGGYIGVSVKGGLKGDKVKRLLRRAVDMNLPLYVDGKLKDANQEVLKYFRDRGGDVLLDPTKNSSDGLLGQEAYTPAEYGLSWDLNFANNLYAYQKMNGMMPLGQLLSADPTVNAGSLQNARALVQRSQLTFTQDIVVPHEELAKVLGIDRLRVALVAHTLEVEPGSKHQYIDTEKGEAMDTTTDGAFFLRHDIFDALLKSVGINGRGGSAKGSFTEMSDPQGVLIGKLLYHRADDSLNAHLVAENLHGELWTTAAKAYGKRTVLTPQVTGGKYSYSGKDYTEIPLNSIRINKSWSEDSAQEIDPKTGEVTREAHALDPVSFVKQIHGNLTGVALNDFIKDASIPSLRGTKRYNGTFIEAFRQKDLVKQADLVKNLNVDDVSLEDMWYKPKGATEAELIPGVISILKRSKYIDTPLYRKVAEKILKLDENIQPEDGERPEGAEDNYNELKSLQNSVRGVLKIVGINPAVMNLTHTLSRYQDLMLVEYVKKRISNPKVFGSTKAVIYGQSIPERLKYGIVNLGTYRLSAGYRDLMVEWPGSEKKVKLEFAYDQYQKAVKAGSVTPEMENAMSHVVGRVPADSASGFRVLKFAGFRDRQGFGTYLHPEDYRNMGGADNDGDTAFIYTKVSRSMKDFYAQDHIRDQWYSFSRPSTDEPSVIKIISGMQSGGDEAGLIVGKKLGLATGGTAPPNFIRHDAFGRKYSDPAMAELYGLTEGSPDPTTFRERTLKNAQDADGTVWFGNADSPGGWLTLGGLAQKGKPLPIKNPTAEGLREWLVKNNIKTLNVAGSREFKNPGVGRRTEEVLTKALAKEVGTTQRLSAEEFYSHVSLAERGLYKREFIPTDRFKKLTAKFPVNVAKLLSGKAAMFDTYSLMRINEAAYKGNSNLGKGLSTSIAMKTAMRKMGASKESLDTMEQFAREIVNRSADAIKHDPMVEAGEMRDLFKAMVGDKETYKLGQKYQESARVWDNGKTETSDRRDFYSWMRELKEAVPYDPNNFEPHSYAVMQSLAGSLYGKSAPFNAYGYKATVEAKDMLGKLFSGNDRRAVMVRQMVGIANFSFPSGENFQESPKFMYRFFKKDALGRQTEVTPQAALEVDTEGNWLRDVNGDFRLKAGMDQEGNPTSSYEKRPRDIDSQHELANQLIGQDYSDATSLIRSVDIIEQQILIDPSLSREVLDGRQVRALKVIAKAQEFKNLDVDRMNALKQGGEALGDYDVMTKDAMAYQDKLPPAYKLLFDTWYLGSIKQQPQTLSEVLKDANGIRRKAQKSIDELTLLGPGHMNEILKKRKTLYEFSPTQVEKRWRATNFGGSQWLYPWISAEAKKGWMDQFARLTLPREKGKYELPEQEDASRVLQTKWAKKPLYGDVPDTDTPISEMDTKNVVEKVMPRIKTELQKMAQLASMGYSQKDPAKLAELEAIEKDIKNLIYNEPTLGPAFTELFPGITRGKSWRFIGRTPDVATLADVKSFVEAFKVKGYFWHELKTMTPEQAKRRLRWYHFFGMPDRVGESILAGDHQVVTENEALTMTKDGLMKQPIKFFQSSMTILVELGKGSHRSTNALQSIWKNEEERRVKVVDNLNKEYPKERIGTLLYEMAATRIQTGRVGESQAATAQYAREWRDMDAAYQKVKDTRYGLQDLKGTRTTRTGEEIITDLERGIRLAMKSERLLRYNPEAEKRYIKEYDGEILIGETLRSIQEGLAKDTNFDIGENGVLRVAHQLDVNDLEPNMPLSAQAGSSPAEKEAYVLKTLPGIKESQFSIVGNTVTFGKLGEMTAPVRKAIRTKLLDIQGANGKFPFAWLKYQPKILANENSMFPQVLHDPKKVDAYLREKIVKAGYGDALEADMSRYKLETILKFAQAHAPDGGERVRERLFIGNRGEVKTYIVDPALPEGDMPNAWDVSSSKGRSQDELGLMPGWDKTPKAIVFHGEQLIQGTHNMLFTMMSNQIIKRFEKTEAMGKEDTPAWASFMKMYVRQVTGQPSTIPAEFTQDRHFSAAINPYRYFSDQFWLDRLNQINDKMGKDNPGDPIWKEWTKGGKNYKVDLKALKNTGSDQALLRKITLASNLEAKFELITLLTHTKTMVNNMIGANTNVAIEVGFGPLKDAWSFATMQRKIRFLKFKGEENPREIRSSQDLWDFAEEQGGMEAFVQQMINWSPQLASAEMAGVARELTAAVQTKGFKGLTFNELSNIGAKYGKSGELMNKAAWFMRTSEVQNRRRAWWAGYMKARTLLDADYLLDSNDPWLIHMANRTVEATQFLYNNASRPAFAATNIGKVFTRFQLYAYNSLSFRGNILRMARETGYQEGTEEFERFKRLAGMDLFALTMASLFPVSMFEANLMEPWRTMQGVTQMLFGSDEEKKKAFQGVLPYPANIVAPLSPPITRAIYPMFTGLMTGEWDKWSSYTAWTLAPFGRLAKGASKTADNPTMILENLVGLPVHAMTKKIQKAQKEDTEPIHGLIGSAWSGF